MRQSDDVGGSRPTGASWGAAASGGAASAPGGGATEAGGRAPIVDELAARDRARVAVFRALQLGDMLVSIPALRALREALPGAEITLVGLPWAAEFVRRFRHLVDAFLPFPGYPGLAEQRCDAAALVQFLRDRQATPFDLVVQMHGSGLLTNPMLAMFGARRMAGFFLPGQFRPDPDAFLPYPAHDPEVVRLLRLAAFLGAEPRGDELEFPIEPEERVSAGALTAELGLDGRAFACVHPGARAPARRWPPERFAEVGDALARRGLRVVLTGTAEEASITTEVSERMTEPAVNLAGRTPLGVTAALLSRARLLVSNDTGIVHVAAALRIPSAAVYLESDPARWAPLDATLHRRVVGPDVERSPCRHLDAPQTHRCLRDGCTVWGRRLEEIDRRAIGAIDVLNEVDALLDEGSSRPEDAERAGDAESGPTSG